jgi:hypothetical protein
MKRYFYTDPLAAAWMAKHFGMKLYRIITQDMVDEYGCGKAGEQFDWTDSSVMQDADTVGDLLFHLYDLDYGCIYVHPDSLHLLQPQLLDLLFYAEQRVCLPVYEEEQKDKPSVDKCAAKHDIEAGICVVMQRNGTPFMWPESEEGEAA